MEIRYDDNPALDRDQVRDLFLALGWDSGNHPDELARGLANGLVHTAWRGDDLAGLIAAISDHHMVAYVTYMAVHPDCQGRGIGRELMARMLADCAHLKRVALICYDEAAGFYEKCGFRPGEGKRPMFVTSLST